MDKFLENLGAQLNRHLAKFLDTKVYLIFADVILAVFAIWFSDAGLLPFGNVFDFSFFVLLVLILAIYRPGWAFLLFVGLIAVENVNLAPEKFGLALRPYQLLAAAGAISLVFRAAIRRLNFSLPKFGWHDALPVIFAAGGFLSALASADKGVSFKQSVVALSFVLIYFLVRVFVQSLDDVKKIMPFFLGGSAVVVLYALLQSVLDKYGINLEVMAGRPNSTFSEPDWLGIYLVFVLAAIYALVYYILKSDNNKSPRIFNFQFLIFNQFQNLSILKQILLSLAMIAMFVALILTVSRSAWLGAFFVSLGFLKIMLTDGSLRISDWNWRKFFHALQLLAVAIICSIGIIYIFGLTRFQLFSRAQSTGGLQKITIACPLTTCVLPEKIRSLSELDSCNCRHINLEDIEKEKAAGYKIEEIYRPDPNVDIRKNIYKKSWQQIEENPILGIGWGNISNILGKDERGAGLNASNIFLEVWLGSGIIGLLSFVILLGYIFTKGAKGLLDRKNEDKTVVTFVMLGWAAIVIPDLFNSGIFLGFVWVYLAIAISLLESRQKI